MYRIYKITFQDGYAYIGQTKYPVADRIRRHINNPDNVELSRRLTSEAYITETLYENIPNFQVATQIESDEIFALEKPINISGINPNAQIKHFGHNITKRNGRKKPKRQRQIEPRPGTYRCSICHANKPHTDFRKDRSRFNGLESRCKVCSGLRKRNRMTSDEAREFIAKGGDPKKRKNVLFASLPESQKQEMVADYESGMTYQEVADKHGLSLSITYSNLIKMGVQTRTRGESKSLKSKR